VNIANFALGRERSGPKPVQALAVVQVDAPVSDTVLEALGPSRRCSKPGWSSCLSGILSRMGFILERARVHLRGAGAERPRPLLAFIVESVW